MRHFSSERLKKRNEQATFLVYVKIVVVIVLFSAFIFYLAATPDSMSFFTAAAESETIIIEFGQED